MEQDLPTGEIERLSPMNLMGDFTRSRFALWIAVAAAVHVVVMALLSIGFIRDTWIDPQGAAQRKAAAAAAKAAAGQIAQAPAPAATNATAAAPSGPVTADQVTMEQRKDTPIVKAVTETPKPGEIPSQPDDLGISIQDTKVK